MPDFIESTGIAKIRQAKRIVLLQGTSEICSRVFLVMLGDYGEAGGTNMASIVCSWELLHMAPFALEPDLSCCGQADMSFRQKSRERVHPKMGKLDIDYQAGF